MLDDGRGFWADAHGKGCSHVESRARGGGETAADGISEGW